MKTCLYSNLPLRNWLTTSILLLLFAAIQAPAVSQHEKPAIQNNFAGNPPDNDLARYTAPDNDDTGVSIYLKQGLTAMKDSTRYPVNPAFPPVLKKLTTHIYPQPANGNSGDMYLVFNQSLEQRLHITIQDMLDRTYYSGWHRAENKLLIRFGQTFPVLSPGSYRVTVVTDGMVARKIFLVE